MKKARQDKTRQDKIRQDKTRQDKNTITEYAQSIVGGTNTDL